MDVVKIASFDEGHQHPNDIIKGIRCGFGSYEQNSQRTQ